METGKYLADFTKREEVLLVKVKEHKLTLPARLAEWRTWIQDSQVYLNELKNFIEKQSKQKKGIK